MAICDCCGKKEEFLCKKCQPTLLTKRQQDILQLIADGISSKEISTQLFISASTVKREVRNIFDVLGCNDRASSVAEALRRDILGKSEILNETTIVLTRPYDNIKTTEHCPNLSTNLSSESTKYTYTCYWQNGKKSIDPKPCTILEWASCPLLSLGTPIKTT